MHRMIRIVLSLMLVGLVACATQDGIMQRQNMAVCKVSCMEKYTFCSHVCHDNCSQCTQGANLGAKTTHQAYVHEMCVRGGTIARELKSYRDPLQCLKSTCNCTADYRICVQACGVVIQKTLQVPGTCSDRYKSNYFPYF